MNESRAKIEWNKVPKVFPSSFESGFAQIRTETINHEFLSRTIGLRNTAGAKGSRPRRMNKITINSNLVRGRLDTIPEEEGKTSRNFQLLFFLDLCSKNGTKFRIHASIFERECILVRRNRSIATARNPFSKNAKLGARLILNYLRHRYNSRIIFSFCDLVFHNLPSDETCEEFQLVRKEKKGKKWKGKQETSRTPTNHSSR